jgi:hypothetical protein
MLGELIFVFVSEAALSLVTRWSNAPNVSASHGLLPAPATTAQETLLHFFSCFSCVRSFFFPVVLNIFQVQERMKKSLSVPEHVVSRPG